MKADIDKDGYLRLDAQSLVQALPDKVLRDVAKYALFNTLLLDGVIGALVDGQMWGADEDPPWWFGSETFTALRLKLLPLLPDIMAEAVRHLEAEARKQRAERLRWHSAAWKLWHAWPDRATRPEHPAWQYEHHATMTKNEAKAYLDATEKRAADERDEIERLRERVRELEGKQAAFGAVSHG